MMDKESYRPGLVRNQTLVQQLKEFQRNPRSLIFVNLAEAYRSEGLPQQSLEILAEGLAVHPDMPSALVAQARALFDLKRYGEASAVCRRMIDQNPDHLKAHKLLAEICVRLGQRKAAIRSLSRVVSLFPQDIEAVRALEELENLETGQIIPVQQISRASSDMRPVKLGKIEEFQVGSFSDSLASIPDDVEASPLVQELEAQDAEEAIPLPGDEGSSPGNEPTFATRTIAELYLRQGLKQKAVRVLRKIIQENPHNTWARETLQDLGTDGIVGPARPSPAQSHRAPLERKVKVLERLLAQVRLRKMGEGA